MSFTLGLACLGTETPQVNALLSLVVIGFSMDMGRKTLFPQEIMALREEAKNDKEKKEKP